MHETRTAFRWRRALLLFGLSSYGSRECRLDDAATRKYRFAAAFVPNANTWRPSLNGRCGTTKGRTLSNTWPGRTSRRGVDQIVGLRSFHSDNIKSRTRAVSAWNHLLTGQEHPERPDWMEADPVLKRLPPFITNLRPSVQLLGALLLYVFHTLVLAQHSMPLPFQLIPNDRGNFQSIGLDS
jgi:hypothetical protein